MYQINITKDANAQKSSNVRKQISLFFLANQMASIKMQTYHTRENDTLSSTVNGTVMTAKHVTAQQKHFL